MPPSSDVALTERYREENIRLRATGAAALAAIWDDLGSWDDADVGRFTERSNPILAAIQTAALALTVGYLSVLTASPVEPPGVEIEQDFRHPFIGLWKALAEGTMWPDAFAAGRERSGVLAHERVVLTQRQTAQHTDAAGITGWRRVPKGDTCEFCRRAAGQRYRTAESASFGHSHHGIQYCDCDIVPIVGRTDPGRILNAPPRGTQPPTRENSR